MKTEPVKVKDLRIPFSWEERRPYFGDRLFHVPARYTEHHLFPFPTWEDPRLFGQNRDVFIEFCSGNGAWIVEQACKYPEKNWVAVELQFDRARKIWARMHNNHLTNLLPVWGEAEPFAEHYLKENSVSGVFINFPDPWPKKRHAPRRIVQLAFMETLSRIVKPQGEIVLVTDDPVYMQQMVQTLLASSTWKPLFPSPHYIVEWPGYGSSYFDQLWRSKGCTIHYLRFVNQK